MQVSTARDTLCVALAADSQEARPARASCSKLAEVLDAALHEALGGSTARYRARLRSLLFHLRDPKVRSQACLGAHWVAVVV